MLDIPKFKSSPQVEQFVFYRLSILFLIISLLYIVIFVNYWALDIMIPSLINWVFIIALVKFGLIIYVLSHMKFNGFYYLFFDDHIEIHDKKIVKVNYSTMKNISYKQNFIDKKFNTGTIKIATQSGKFLILKHLSDSNQVFFFMQKKISASLHP